MLELSLSRLQLKLRRPMGPCYKRKYRRLMNRTRLTNGNWIRRACCLYSLFLNVQLTQVTWRLRLTWIDWLECPRIKSNGMETMKERFHICVLMRFYLFCHPSIMGIITSRYDCRRTWLVSDDDVVSVDIKAQGWRRNVVSQSNVINSRWWDWVGPLVNECNLLRTRCTAAWESMSSMQF